MSTRVPREELLHVPAVQPRCRILVMGVGGAGCNVVSRMASLISDGPPMIALNTDTQSLAACRAPRCLQIGEKTTNGLGAAGDVAAGRLAAEESADKIKEAMGGTDFLVLFAGMGGGTGTGAAPVIAQIARKLGVLTLCFATMPFPFEGDRRRRQAEEGLRNLQNTADAVVCQPNERLLELFEQGVAVEESFRRADAIVAEGVLGLHQLLSKPGVINLNFADVRQLVERSGSCCAYGFSSAEGPARATEVIRRLNESPLLENGRLIAESAALLVNITGGPDLTLADVQGVMGQITSMARPGVHLFFGAVVEASYRGKLALTVLAAENWLEERRDPAAGQTMERDADKAAAVSAKEEELPLALEPPDKGRFKGVDPTYVGGEDLDIPTYIRRGARLSTD